MTKLLFFSLKVQAFPELFIRIHVTDGGSTRRHPLAYFATWVLTVEKIDKTRKFGRIRSED